LPNEEKFAELARMGYEKPSTKLTFYKAFFLAQWKFLIHTILQCMSPKRTTWRGCIQTRGIIAKIDADEDVILEEVEVEKDAKVAEKDDAVQGRQEESQVNVYHIDLEHADKVLKVVTIATTPITIAPSAAKRRKGVVIKDPKETATPSTIVHSELKSKDKGKGILVEEPKPLKKQAQIEPIFEKHFNSIVGFLEKIEKELEEEASKALKRKSESSEQQATKKQKLDKETIKSILKNNKPHYKIIRADGTHQLFLSFISLLWNFDREDMDMLWQIIQERFASLKPKNFPDDFLLTTLKAMFEKADVEAHIWKNQRGIHGLAKVKSWKLLESYGVHIITFITTQMILLVERRYPLTRFTLDQMLNNVRLEVKEESEVLLELLRFRKRQQQEGYRPDFGVDAVEDFKEFTLRDFYCWLKTYCCWYKLKLLDNAADSRLRLLKQSVAADDKMKK
nr:hypothetical protein [Tanacetum cinerariifolium]